MIPIEPPNEDDLAGCDECPPTINLGWDNDLEPCSIWRCPSCGQWWQWWHQMAGTWGRITPRQARRLQRRWDRRRRRMWGRRLRHLERRLDRMRRVSP